MRYAVLKCIVLFAALVLSASAQQTTTTTNCNVYGNQVNCTSTDNSAAVAAQAERQRENDEAMRQTGSALGAAMARGIQMHKFHKWQKKYCKAHPSSSWWYQFDITNPSTRITGTCE